MTRAYRNARDAQTVAIMAIGWIVADPGRAERFLGLTGLDPDALRAGIGDAAVQRAAIDYLAGHEPDLIACAETIGETPEALAALGGALDKERG